MKKPSVIAAIGALLGFTSVLMGAAADHVLGTTHRMAIALHYHQFYALLITLLGLILHAGNFAISQRRRLTTAAWFFIPGVVIFCGGLYSADKFPFAVYGAPIGGFFLMAGWAALATMFTPCRWCDRHDGPAP